MPDSQSHRPAVSVKKPLSNRLNKLLERTVDLEKQLTNLSKSNDEKAARLRSHLCEVLSDILISDPLVGIQNDCTGRLWRSCFYAPIGIWRNRISREKRKQGLNVASLEQSFKRFLGEAITLYDYVVLQYQSKLVPSANQGNSQDSTQESLQPTEPEQAEGVIPGLYRLYIHMGDLNRYAQAYNKAENCYLNAAKLAPGMGNPYNQLAVVAQMKDASMSCVALYWYARSLLATHDSFETSSSNLERLFNINRGYLKEHSRETTPPVLSQGNKKMSSDLLRAQKAAASKSCLAHFVDFHYELFKNSETDDSKQASLRAKMTAIMQSLQSLLQASAFGDALLCKMVVINTFSLEMNKESDNMINRRLSNDFLFMLGSNLAGRLKHGLSKIVEKNGKLPPSIRLLLPFEILCEYVGHLKTDDRTDDQKEFWNQLVEVANLVLQLSQRLDMTVSSTSETISAPLKEYQLLKGYRPFTFLHKDYLSEKPFVRPVEAVDMLELTLSQSHESMSNGGCDENNVKVMRFIAFCNRGSEKQNIPLSKDDCGYSFVDERRNLEEAIADQEMADADVFNDDGPADEGVPVKAPGVEADEAGDVVLYKAPEVGGGPSLLVPGILLTIPGPAPLEMPVAASKQDQQAAEVNGDRQIVPDLQLQNATSPVLERESEMSKLVHSNTLTPVEKSLPPPPGITPPPGFGAPVPQPISTGTPAFLQQGFYGQVIPGYPGHMAAFPSVPQPQPPSFGHMVSSNPLYGAPASSLGQNIPAVAQPMQWFGGPESFQTANPFASPPANFGFANPPNPVFEAEASNVDGASLLGSGFLDSLWMNDSPRGKTKNPFATNH
jgi:hypothetical protein